MSADKEKSSSKSNDKELDDLLDSECEIFTFIYIKKEEKKLLKKIM